VLTLVVSDLHLGARYGRARLSGSEDALQALVGAVREADRIVLLGDTLELREGPLREALGAARPVLRELGLAARPGSEIVIVPGNHDHFLLAAWSDRRATAPSTASLTLETGLDWRDGDLLGAVAGALAAGGARVRAAYPGVWLREDVWATHGHYLDRHTTVPMIERLSAGANARLLRRTEADITSPDDYEDVLGPGYAWVHALAQTRVGAVQAAAPAASVNLWQSLGSGARRGGGIRRRAANAGLDGAVRLLNRFGIGPLRSDLSPPELRRAGLAAMCEVVRALAVPAGWVLFGHTHRAGPLPGDSLYEWRAPDGTRLLNSGSWVIEPAFLGERPAESPYRAGFAVRLSDATGSAPELVNLLDQDRARL
jgi:hypothetical protein